ncbi:hypothetical protein XCR_1075 [Xanthomonas campestris pv. raphani 756C]|nr:hypothetical protein XCR_1075 [Xanthomonas campestris pv. raphani 756C]
MLAPEQQAPHRTGRITRPGFAFDNAQMAAVRQPLVPGGRQVREPRTITAIGKGA